jgi:flavin-dependent thymidylate synthase
MQVTLLDYTGAGSENPGRYAASILLYTKSTRLQMSPDLLQEIKEKSDEEIMFNLRLMADTNPGSWEFVYLTFFIEDATRALQQQLTRTRTASYAIQTTRLVDMRDFKYDTGPSIKGNIDREVVYDYTMRTINHAYKELIKQGAEIEDARGVLPLNVYSNINMSINLRNWVNLVRKRESIRVQTPYRKMVDMMVMEVEKVYPWIYLFVKNDELKARKDLQQMIYDNNKLSGEEKTAMIKKLDIIIKDL